MISGFASDFPANDPFGDGSGQPHRAAFPMGQPCLLGMLDFLDRGRERRQQSGELFAQFLLHELLDLSLTVGIALSTGILFDFPTRLFGLLLRPG